MTIAGAVEKIVALFLFKNPSINMLLLVCLTYFVSGYVFIRHIQSKNNEFNQFKLLLSPLFGFSFISIFLNTAVIFGMQMKFLIVPILLELFISLILIVYDRFKFLNFRVITVIIASLFVLLFSSIGLFNLGKNYLGYGWVDSLNYISTAEVLKNYSLKTPKSDLISKPYLIPGIDAREDRIAQSLMITFFSLLTGKSVKFIFGPIILSSVFMFFISIFLLTKLYFKSLLKSIFVAVNIGISSAFAMIHIETFLSHALAMPYVISYLFLVESFKKNISKYNLLCLGFLFSTLFFLYPELIPILILISVPYILIYFRRPNFSSIVVFISVVTLFFVINKYVVLNIIFNRVSTKLSVLDPIYSFSGTIFMLNRILFGHIDIWNFRTFFSLVLVLLSIINIYLIIKNKERDKYGIIATLIFLVLLFPLSLSYKYHYFKLFLTISPFAVLSFYIFLDRLANKNKYFNIVFYLILVFCLFFTAKGTRNIIRFTYLPGERSQIGGLYINEDSQLYDNLEKTRNKTLLINGRNSMETAWLTYHARNNNVKVISSDFAMRDISEASPKIIFGENDNIEMYKIIFTQKFPEIIKNNQKLYPYFSNNQGLEGSYPNQFSWIGKKAEFGFISEIDELNGHLFLDFSKGPFTDQLVRNFTISYGKNILHKGKLDKARDQYEYPVTFNKGMNLYTITSALSKQVKSNTSDSRDFNILISDFKLFVCDGKFQKLFYILPENDGWVTSSGFKIIGCIIDGTNDISIDFNQLVTSDKYVNFKVNGLLMSAIIKQNKINISGINKFSENNYLSIKIEPEFFKKIDKDTRELSFFPTNYEKN